MPVLDSLLNALQQHKPRYLVVGKAQVDAIWSEKAIGQNLMAWSPGFRPVDERQTVTLVEMTPALHRLLKALYKPKEVE